MATRISHSFLRGLSALIGCLVALLCGCRNAVEPAYGVVAYGMPWANYVVSGQVTVRVTHQPVSGIQVSLADTLQQSANLAADTTDATGRYELAFGAFPRDYAWRLSSRDIDGPANGLFTPKDTVVSIPESTLTGGDGQWNAGNGQKTVDLEMDSAQ
jgi:putative lipoprotein (rSAM/lipoprotein system)